MWEFVGEEDDCVDVEIVEEEVSSPALISLTISETGRSA
jgi:hypothetical protein